MTIRLGLKERGRVMRALRRLVPTFPSRAAAALAIGISDRSLASVLSGETFVPGAKVTRGAARLLGVTPEQLLTTPNA